MVKEMQVKRIPGTVDLKTKGLKIKKKKMIAITDAKQYRGYISCAVFICVVLYEFGKCPKNIECQKKSTDSLNKVPRVNIKKTCMKAGLY
jgi:hypothetical protein